MPHSFVTVIARIECSEVEPLRAEIAKLGNPAKSGKASEPSAEMIGDALDAMNCIHFVSLHAFTSSSGESGYLVLELSADGAANDVLAQLDKSAGRWLQPLFKRAIGFHSGQNLAEFWHNHSYQSGPNYFQTIGLPFTGSPGMAVARIRQECELTKFVADFLYDRPMTPSSLDRLNDVRRHIRQNPKFASAMQAEPLELFGEERSALQAVFNTLLVGFLNFLWPAVLFAAIAGFGVWYSTQRILYGIIAVLGVFVATLGVVAFAIWRLRRAEKTDVPDARNPSDEHLQAVMVNENYAVQNHLFVHSVLKPGILRRVALRGALFAIGQLAKRQFKPGFLGEIGTIHFARWIVFPGSRDLLFFSNYGGSWESYLEDFITKAHLGLTSVWSNTLGFPRARYLAFDGATDGDRFKQWARNHQVPTLFWYSAYPGLSTSNIRMNAAVRRGLVTAETEDQARRWLRLFGSAPAPAGALETSEIQSLFYGGFRTLYEAECVLVQFDGNSPKSCGQWLDSILPEVAFGDRLPPSQAVTLSLTASGIRKFGLSEDVIASFPGAFQHGMIAPWRSRVLGDVEKNAPDSWLWGNSDSSIDCCLLLYADDPQTLKSLTSRIESGLTALNHRVLHRIPLATLPPKLDSDDAKSIEPFGFRDGISQPIVRGTFQAARTPDPLHLVEPGEILLGYPDNRGYYPPTPQITAPCDPNDLLSTIPPDRVTSSDSSTTQVDRPRDLGKNGTYLVIRQLEQNVKGFWNSATNAAAEIRKSSPSLSWIDEEWVAAKLVGRWRNGSSLVRNPTFPATSKKATSAPLPDNTFRFGADDPQGLRCPFGAHIRRANPRDSFAPGSQDQLTITNRHRILRRGRAYEPQNGNNPGLFFICLNADLERQFEFIQQTWIGNRTFHGLTDESDCVSGLSRTSGFTIPTEHGPIHVPSLPTFVRVLGGAYFFMPGRRTLLYLSRHAIAE